MTSSHPKMCYLVSSRDSNVLTHSHHQWLSEITPSLAGRFTLALCPVWSVPGVGDKAMGSRRKGYASIGPSARWLNETVEALAMGVLLSLELGKERMLCPAGDVWWLPDLNLETQAIWF